MQREGAPPLPTGYSIQRTYEFRDVSGRFSYEFSNVYGPPKADKRGPVCQLDHERCFWSVSGFVDGAAPEPARSVSFAEARLARGGHLTFRQFASSLHMRRELPTLL